MSAARAVSVAACQPTQSQYENRLRRSCLSQPAHADRYRAAKRSGKDRHIRVTDKRVPKYLGVWKYRRGKQEERDEIGLAGRH